jgi:hypothetical protein
MMKRKYTVIDRIGGRRVVSDYYLHMSNIRYNLNPLTKIEYLSKLFTHSRVLNSMSRIVLEW